MAITPIGRKESTPRGLDTHNCQSTATDTLAGLAALYGRLYVENSMRKRKATKVSITIDVAKCITAVTWFIWVLHQAGLL